MKALGIKQFQQKSFKLMDLKGSPFEAILAKVPMHFVCIIYGFSGNGKTEFCLQLAKELTKHGKVAWMSYEQRHGFDLQQATLRNGMQEVSGRFIPIDPIANLADNVSYLEDLDKYLSKRNSPDYIFFDSLDYTEWTLKDYVYLKEKYEGKKSFIFIAHTDESGKLELSVSRKVRRDGGIGIYVKDYIAHPKKNRFGNGEPYVIWEKKAREINPLFFDPKTKVETKKANKQPELFEKSEPETKGVTKKVESETKGVRAKSKLKKVG